MRFHHHLLMMYPREARPRPCTHVRRVCEELAIAITVLELARYQQSLPTTITTGTLKVYRLAGGLSSNLRSWGISERVEIDFIGEVPVFSRDVWSL